MSQRRSARGRQPSGPPLQGILSDPAMRRVTRAAEGGNPQARALVSYFVSQGVGLVDGVRSVRSVVLDFMTEYAEALQDMRALGG